MPDDSDNSIRTATAPADALAGAGTVPEAVARPPVVLVIEDEPTITEAIRFILQRDGWVVRTHDRGHDALECIRDGQPALVILDVMLPGRSGFDILQAMRAQPGLAQTPVIMLTAKGHQQDRARAERDGASLFMTKPFANAELVAAVRHLIGQPPA